MAKLHADGFKAIAAPGNVADAADTARMAEARSPGSAVSTCCSPTPARRRPRGKSPRRSSIELPRRCGRRCRRLTCSACSAAARRRGGAIVSTPSIAGLPSAGSSMAYGATRAGVVSLTKNLARGLAPEVEVIAVAPGAVDSSYRVEWTNEQSDLSVERGVEAARHHQ